MNKPLPLIDASPVLVAEDLVFMADGCKIIDRISLTLKCGEFVAIIGPNGAGKSSLLRLLTGYLQPQMGECCLLGRRYSDWPPEQLAYYRAVMCQHSNLVFPFTVHEVVAMGRSIHTSQDDEQIISSVMAQTECTDLAERDYRTLSGGEQQRVQLARALAQLWQPISKPAWLFLDEPTSALDLYHQQHTLRLLKKLTRTQSLSVCCVLHDLNLAALYADRILLLYQGKLVEHGPPEQVLTAEKLAYWYQAEIDVHVHPNSGLPQIFLRQ